MLVLYGQETRGLRLNSSRSPDWLWGLRQAASISESLQAPKWRTRSLLAGPTGSALAPQVHPPGSSTELLTR